MWERFGIYFKEPSTWQGIIGFLTLFGVALSGEQKAAVAEVGVALYFALDTFFRHGAPTTPPPDKPLEELVRENQG